MSSNAEFEQDRIFKALSHRRRRELLDRLRDGPQTTGALCAAFADMDRCTVMLHLRVLTDAGLVVSQRQGRERWNYLNVLPIRHIHDRWISEYASPADAMPVRLDAASCGPQASMGCA